jgi:hypothetical protein
MIVHECGKKHPRDVEKPTTAYAGNNHEHRAYYKL